MKRDVVLVVLGMAALVVLGGRADATAMPPGEGVVDLAGPPEGVASPDWRDDAIRRAFEDVLRRGPSSSERRRYRSRMEEDGWTEEDIRRDLRTRDDYRSRRGITGAEADRIVRRAYEDILDREPDPEGLRGYRRAMIDDGWSEQDVREELRKSPEYAQQRRKSAERIVRRAYQDILHRPAEPGGLNLYTNKILNQNWDEADVREALRRSPERRELQETMSRQRAEEIVRSAYRNVLKREADPPGMRGFVDRVMRDRWTQSQVEAELRKSDEYRELNRMTREKAEAIVRGAYRNVLRRDPDDAGMRNYVNRVMRDRWSQAQVEAELRKSDEYKNMRR